MRSPQLWTQWSPPPTGARLFLHSHLYPQSKSGMPPRDMDQPGHIGSSRIQHIHANTHTHTIYTWTQAHSAHTLTQSQVHQTDPLCATPPGPGMTAGKGPGEFPSPALWDSCAPETPVLLTDTWKLPGNRGAEQRENPRLCNSPVWVGHYHPPGPPFVN